jgi:hypothetical protein
MNLTDPRERLHRTGHRLRRGQDQREGAHELGHHQGRKPTPLIAGLLAGARAGRQSSCCPLGCRRGRIVSQLATDRREKPA